MSPTDDSGQNADLNADLQAGLAALAGLVAGSMDLPELLAEVAGFAQRALPGADGVGVALLDADRPGQLAAAHAASTAVVEQIDRIQYDTLREGPGITVAMTRATVRSGSLGGEKLWPRFGPRAGRLGVHSVLALPLTVADHVIGTIGVYSFAKDVFDEHAVALGEMFAKPAAVAVHNAHILAQAVALTVQLQTALATRPVIDQAIGLIRGRTGRSAEEALAQLKAISQADHRKLSDVAQHVIDEAVRRARARPSGS
ncbi:GAF and ANTAR domain-containing protein [soil metagenome]